MFFTGKLFQLVQCLMVKQELTLLKNILDPPLQGRLLNLPTNNRLDWKGLLGIKLSSFLQKFVNHGQKSFITLGPGVNVIKLFCPQFAYFRNRLECFSQASFFSLVKCLWANQGACPRLEHLKDASFGQGPALPSNNRLGWKGLPGTESSFLRKSVNYDEIFFNIDSRYQCDNFFCYHSRCCLNKPGLTYIGYK